MSFDAMSALQHDAEVIIARNPAVAHVVSRAGSNGLHRHLNQGSFFVELKDRARRPPLAKTIADLRRDLAALPGIQVFITPVQNLRLGGRQSKSQYQYVLQGLDRIELERWTTRLTEAMAADRATFAGVTNDLQNAALQASISVDTDKARALASRPTRSARRSIRLRHTQISTIYGTADS